jgi:hypothetical protein
MDADAGLRTVEDLSFQRAGGAGGPARATVANANIKTTVSNLFIFLFLQKKGRYAVVSRMTGPAGSPQNEEPLESAMFGELTLARALFYSV